MPVNIIAGMDNQLRTPIPLPKRVQHIDISVIGRHFVTERLKRQVTQIIFFFQTLHNLITFRFQIGEVAKAGIVLIDIHAAQLARPGTNILEKLVYK